MNNKFLVVGLPLAISLLGAACSTQKKTAKLVSRALLHKPEVATAHVGISIMDAATGKYIYNYQGDKYAIPASNTKLLTCYATMKHLGDSLVGLRYEERSDETLIQATGDPTLLHPDFKTQPVYEFLKTSPRIVLSSRGSTPAFFPFGRGWAWDDYQDDYMAERSELPIYGNCAWFTVKKETVTVMPRAFDNNTLHPVEKGSAVKVVRNWEDNTFQGRMQTARQNTVNIAIPFKTIENGTATGWRLLEDTLNKKIGMSSQLDSRLPLSKAIHSQPTDTLLKIMMHRSDNFFAEQSLLMVSNTMLGHMSDSQIIDSLLRSDYAAMPQKPQWVDGSGLSRYNLITPQDFVWLLRKMKQEFSWQRITGIFQTGGQGTLSSYYKKYAGRIYAKTGTLSNNVALSGYLITNKGKTLAFSVIVNNHKAVVSNIRREVEELLGNIIEKY